VDEQVTGNVGGVSAVGRMSQNSSSGLIPRQEVLRRTSLSKRSLWRYIAADLFPRPVPIGPGRVAWLEAEVEAWIAGCVGQRDKDKDVARPQCRLWKEPTRLGQQFKMDLAEARQALHDARYDLAACSCSRAAERLIAAQGDRDSDAATLVAFLRTLARISTDRNSPNNGPSNPFLLDEAHGQAVPPGDGRGFLEEIGVQDNG